MLEKGMWYRPAVFEDDDLLSIAGEPRFARCRELSERRYTETLAQAKPELSLHGGPSVRLDEDCLPQARSLAAELGKLGRPAETVYIEGLGHEISADMGEILSKSL